MTGIYNGHKAENEYVVNKRHTYVIQGVALVGISSLFYGMYGIFTRLLGHSVGVFSQSVVRSLIILIFVLPYGLRRGQIFMPKSQSDRYWLLVLFLSAGFTVPPIYFAMNRIGIGLAIVIFYACFLLVMQGFDYLFEHKKFYWHDACTIVLALLGLGLVFDIKGSAFDVVGAGAAAVSGLATGLDVLATKYLDGSSIQALAWTWIAGLIVNVLLLLTFREQLPAISSVRTWLLLGGFGLISLGASLTLIKGVRLISSGLAGLVGLLEIIFGIVFGIIFFNEKLTGRIAIGSIAILIAAALPNIVTMVTTKRGIHANN